MILGEEAARQDEGDAIEENGENADDEERAGTSERTVFLASKSWFHRFLQRYNLQSVSLHGEIASADTEAAKRYPAVFKKIIDYG
jgi:hypothetical protein